METDRYVRDFLKNHLEVRLDRCRWGACVRCRAASATTEPRLAPRFPGLRHRCLDYLYLTLMGYGINAATYNSNPGIYSTACTPTPACTAALAQSTSLSTASNYIPRVVALISANGTVNTSTAVTNVFNGNNPRSVVTTNGQSFYIAGQGISGDTTEGVFLVQKGASSATAINTTYDARSVEIYNNQLYVSADSKVGSGQTAYIATLGSLPTGSTNITSQSLLISSGSKNSSFPGSITFTSSSGSSGLSGLTGKLVGNSVELFATNETLTDLGQTYLYGITDSLDVTAASQVSGEMFQTLATAPADTDFKGVAFAPVPLPTALPLLFCGLVGLGAVSQRRRVLTSS